MDKDKKQVDGKKGTLSVTVNRTQIGTVKEDSEEREQIEVSRFITEPAYVTFACGATKNMGNYESLRIEVRVTLPCYVEEIDEIYLKAKGWVDNRLDKELSELAGKTKAI